MGLWPHYHSLYSMEGPRFHVGFIWAGLQSTEFPSFGLGFISQSVHLLGWASGNEVLQYYIVILQSLRMKPTLKRGPLCFILESETEARSPVVMTNSTERSPAAKM